jgi:hypothetical protein
MIMLKTSVVDACRKLPQALMKLVENLMLTLMTLVENLLEVSLRYKFAASVNDAEGKFATSVTGSAPQLRISLQIFNKKF